MDNSENILEDLPLTEVPEVESDEELDLVEEYTLVEYTSSIHQQLTTLTNISIVSMVGIGILVGILCNMIYARYLK